MSTTVSDFTPTVTAAGVTDVTVTRVWPSVTTATATFTDVYPDQIGEYSPNVARAEDLDSQEFPFCALFGAITASDNCLNPSDTNKDMCQAAGGLMTICGTLSGEDISDAVDPEALRNLADLNNLKLKPVDHDKRSFLDSYDGWCNSFDDSTQAQEEDPYTQDLLADGAAGFFGVDIETDEQRAAWLKIGQAFHGFYCGDEGGARDLWKLISTVEPWNDLAAATSVSLTLVWEGGDVITPTPTPTPEPIPEPTPEGALDAMKKVGLETSEDADDTPGDNADSPEPEERLFDFDASAWISSLLTATTSPATPAETPDAAMQTGELESDEIENYERQGCPYCDQAAGVAVDTGLLGGIMALAGLAVAFGM